MMVVGYGILWFKSCESLLFVCFRTVAMDYDNESLFVVRTCINDRKDGSVFDLL